MRKNYLFKQAIVATVICSLSINISGCSLTGFVDRLRDPKKLSKELHENPRFWNDVTPYSESDGLYVLNNEFFNRKPYNNIMSFGDNILLIGQGTYLENVNDIVDNDSLDFKFSFDLYNPWSNQLTASIDHDSVSCDNYQIVGNKLFLLNYDKDTIDVYDDALNFTQRYNASSLGELDDISFYPSDSDKYFFAYNSSSKSIQKITAANFESETVDFDLYNCKVESATEDGSYLLLSGVDKLTLKYKVAAYDTSTLAQTSHVFGQNFSLSDVTADGFITGTNATSNEWTYYNTTEKEQINFNLSDIRDTMILPDGSFILHQEEAYEQDDDYHDITYYHISSSGEILSSFTFDCGSPSLAGYTYFSANFAYLEDCNSIMFLTYTTDVNPYVLVWKLDDTNSKGDKLELSAPKGPEHKIKDWGKLSKANELATSLEKKYGISIYIGKEVPTEIDAFSAKQATKPADIISALNALDKLLSCYPKNFLPQLCYGDLKGLKIYLTGNLSSTNSKMLENASGFATTTDSYLIITLDITYSWDWDYTVHHEISHMIDSRLTFLSEYAPNASFSEDAWSKLNPGSFEYMNTYDNYENNANYYMYPSYFVDAYGTTFATEDRAEIFGRAMDDYLNGIDDDSLFNRNNKIYDKLKFYSKCIREGFDTTDWDYTVPWESVL